MDINTKIQYMKIRNNIDNNKMNWLLLSLNLSIKIIY
jgi:hypothetical protein